MTQLKKLLKMNGQELERIFGIRKNYRKEGVIKRPVVSHSNVLPHNAKEHR